MMGLLRRAFAAYSAQLTSNPWRTQIVSTGVLWASGDVLAQSIEGDEYSSRRNAYTALYGAAAVGPLGHAWYQSLDSTAARLFRPGSVSFICFKVVADTAVFGPAHVAGYFTHMTLCEGGGWAGVRAKLAADFVPTFAAEVLFWPGLQALNFRLVPLQYQLLVVNLATIADSAFMSWARSQDDWFGRLFPDAAARIREIKAALGVAAAPDSGGRSGSGAAGGSRAGGGGKER